MNKKQLVRAGGLYFIGNIFDKALAFFTVPIFTRLLSTSDYGIVTIYLSWENVLSVVLTLSLANSLRTALIDFPEDKNGYTSSIFALSCVSAAVLSLVVIAAGRLSRDKTLVELLPLCCVHAFATGIIQAVQLRYMLDIQYKRRTMLQCLPNLTVVLLSMLLISRMKTERYYGRIYAYVIVMTSVAVAYVLYYFAKGKRFYVPAYWKYGLSFSLPVIFHGMSLVILSQADRSMLMWLRDTSEAGIYGLAYQFGQVPTVITTTFENIWAPWFISKMQEEDWDAINRRAKSALMLVAVMCIGIMVIAPFVLKIMAAKEYYGAITMIVPVVAATYFLFMSGFAIQLEYYKKQTKIIAVNTIVAAVLNIVLNYFFIPIYGGMAAAFTTTFSYVISFVMHYIYARRLEKELFPIKIYILPIALITVGTVCMQMIMG